MFADDPELKEFGDIYNEADYIFSKLIEEFRPFAFEHTEGDMGDYRHYLFKFLSRTWRIFQSISILIFYDRISEVIMLQRPFIENIVNTKIFIKRRSRAKAMRRIRLYEILNNALYCEFLKKDLDEDIEKEGFTFASNINVLNDMSKEVEDDLINYEELEIDKMITSIRNNMGWHGEKMKNALSISNMRQHSQTYDLSCMFLHVREPNPFFNAEKPFLLNAILMTSFEHLSDFGTICNKAFTYLSLHTKIEDNKTKLHQLAFKEMVKWWEADPNRKKIIIKEEQ
jgi:hypothetical protein